VGEPTKNPEPSGGGRRERRIETLSPWLLATNQLKRAIGRVSISSVVGWSLVGYLL